VRRNASCQLLDLPGAITAPAGSIGFRWGESGKWNLEQKAGGSGVRTVNVSIPASAVVARFEIFDRDTTEGTGNDLDLMLLNGAGTAVARCTRFHPKGTETNQGDVLTALQRSGYDGCEGFQRASGSGLREVGGARYSLDEIVFIHV